MPAISNIPAIPFGQLASRIAGELNSGSLLRRIYATDASEYQELPAGVVFPPIHGRPARDHPLRPPQQARADPARGG
jgi:hypothetical protein